MAGEELDLELAIGDAGVAEEIFWRVEFEEGKVVGMGGFGEAWLLPGEVGDKRAPEVGGVGEADFVEG